MCIFRIRCGCVCGESIRKAERVEGDLRGMIPWLTSSSRVRRCWSLSWRTALRQRRRELMRTRKTKKSGAVPRVSTQQRSIYRVQIYSEAQELKYMAGIRSQFILPFRGSSFTLFFSKQQKAGARRA